MANSWQVGPAFSKDLDQIERLVASVGGDLERLRPEEFIVARDNHGQIVGCARLKPYSGFWELASVAVSEDWRVGGIGREIITRLLHARQGPIYLVCEDDVVEFFRRFGFDLVPISEMLPGLESKLERYATQAGHINVMKRD